MASLTADTFDVTDYIRYGEENTLAVKVYRWCDGSWLEDQDYFDLSDRVKEMHSEIFSLKGKLSEAVTLQCVNKECIQRNNGSESASSSTSLIPA